MPLHIRPFRLGDEPFLLAVHRSAIRRVACRDYGAEQIAAWAPEDVDTAQWAARMQALAPFVAESCGAIVGYADVQPSGYIDHFFVSGDHPGQGIGRALMERLHAQAQAWRLQTLHADVSLTAEPFFARFGFTVVERRMPMRRGVALPNALMRKAL